MYNPDLGTCEMSYKPVKETITRLPSSPFFSSMHVLFIPTLMPPLNLIW